MGGFRIQPVWCCAGGNTGRTSYLRNVFRDAVQKGIYAARTRHRWIFFWGTNGMLGLIPVKEGYFRVIFILGI